MTKEEQQEMAKMLTREQQSVKNLEKWVNELKPAEIDKERDVLDRFEAFKYRTDCENMIEGKKNQIYSYMNIQKNILNQQKEKGKEEKGSMKKVK